MSLWAQSKNFLSKLRLLSNINYMKVSTRFPLEFPVSVSFEPPSTTQSSGTRNWTGVSNNLSVSGLGIGLIGKAMSLPVGSEVNVRIAVDDDDGKFREIAMSAKVIWCRDGLCGLKIIQIGEQERFFYDSIIHGYQTLCRGFAGLQIAG